MSSEYVTDVAYVRHFDDDLSPHKLRLVAALNGFPTPPAEGFDYCELGCAHGDTTVVLAAANPTARFVGVDLNPDHVASGRALATEGGLGNVRLLECDFEELAKEKIPDLDFICAHGVLSWVGPAKRKAILDFAAAKLKPGGLLYVSYNAMPGWAALEPLRQLLLSPTTGIECDSAERARRGLAFAKEMHDGGAEYFIENPSAKRMLATMEAQGLSYIAHEYLNAAWAPMYFAQVAWEMTASDLHFVGQIPLFLNYRDLAIPPPLAKLFEKVVDRPTFESLKDFALNEFFRRDIYVKGKPGRSAAATDAYFASTPFGLSVDARGGREVRLPHATLRLDGPIFDALFDTLTEGARTVAKLALQPKLAGYGASRVRAALLRALLADAVAPMLSGTRSVDVPEEAKLFGLPSEYNQAVVRRRLSNDTPIVVASPVTGSGIAMPALYAISLRMLTEVPVAQRREWTRDLFGKQKFRLNVSGRTVEGEEEQAAIVLDAVEEFRKKRLAKLIELGILG